MAQFKKIRIVNDWYDLPLFIGDFVVPICGDVLRNQISGKITHITLTKKLIDILDEDNVFHKDLNAKDFSTQYRLFNTQNHKNIS